MDKDIGTLFLKVFKNVILRNLIFYHLQTMKLSFENKNSYYLGNRMSFSLVISLSWISKRNQWPLLKDKLNNNEELIIKSKSIFKLLSNCKDVELLKLLYTKKKDQMNKVDLVFISVETNNYEALKLFSGSYGEEFKIPTNKAPLDRAISQCNIQYVDYLLKFRDEGNTNELVFKINYDEPFIRYLLDHPQLYKGKQSLITFPQFLNHYVQFSQPLQKELVDKKLVSVENRLHNVSLDLERKFSNPFLLSDGIEYYLKHYFPLNKLFGNRFIGDCFIFKIFKNKDSNALLEFIKIKNVNSNIWKLLLDWSIFKDDSVKLLNGLIEFGSQNLEELLAKLYPIKFNNEEGSISNIAFTLFLKFKNMGISNSNLIIKSIYQFQVAETCNIQVFDELVSKLKEIGINQKEIGSILFNNTEYMEYNYFGNFNQQNSKSINEFLDRCLAYNEFNFNYKTFYINLNCSFNDDSEQLYLDTLLKLKSNIKCSSLLFINESIICLLNKTSNIGIKIQIIGNFLNNFTVNQVTNILNELMEMTKRPDGNGIIDVIIEIISLWNGEKLKIDVATSNLDFLNRLIYIGGNNNLDFTWSIDYLISNCLQENQLQVIEIIKKLVLFQNENKIYQLKTNDSISTDTQLKYISHSAIRISKKRNLMELLNFLLFQDFKDLFHDCDSDPTSPPLKTLDSQKPHTMELQINEISPPLNETQFKRKINLNKLLKKGQIGDVLYYYRKNKLESKVPTTLDITIPQILKIIKYCNYEIAIEYLNIYLNEPTVKSIPYKCLSHSLKNNRLDIYSYIFPKSKLMDQITFTFDIVHFLGKDNGHIPLIKYILSSDLFSNSVEDKKRVTVYNLFSASIVASNFQLFKWLLDSTENPYFYSLSKSKEGILKFITQSNLTPTSSFIKSIENYQFS